MDLWRRSTIHALWTFRLRLQPLRASERWDCLRRRGSFRTHLERQAPPQSPHYYCSIPFLADGECSQVLTHPAISVWVVTTMPNGDIVTGASDGVIRIFSESQDRWASAADLQAYEETIARQALPSQQMEGLNTNDLPGIEALAEPGGYFSRCPRTSLMLYRYKVRAAEAREEWQRCRSPPGLCIPVREEGCSLIVPVGFSSRAMAKDRRRSRCCRKQQTSAIQWQGVRLRLRRRHSGRRAVLEASLQRQW